MSEECIFKFVHHEFPYIQPFITFKFGSVAVLWHMAKNTRTSLSDRGVIKKKEKKSQNQTNYQTCRESWASRDRFPWTLLVHQKNTEAKQPYYVKTLSDTLQDSWKIIQYVNTIHYCTETTRCQLQKSQDWKSSRRSKDRQAGSR